MLRRYVYPKSTTLPLGGESIGSTGMKKTMLTFALVFWGALHTSQAHADKLAAPTFVFWDEVEVEQMAEEKAKDISLKIPEKHVAQSLAYLGMYLVEQLIDSGAVDRQEEAPKLIQYSNILNEFRTEAIKFGDFHYKTLEASTAAIKAYKERTMLLGSLMNRSDSRVLAKKLLRLEVELESRNKQ